MAVNLDFKEGGLFDFSLVNACSGLNLLLRLKAKMDISKGVGFMAVFAVSGSVVLLSLQLHKRLLSDFMKKVESELGGVEKVSPKRKVRFAEDVVEPSSNNKAYRLRHSVRLGTICDQAVTMKCNMPPNRRVLYEGVLRYRALKRHTALHCC